MGKRRRKWDEQRYLLDLKSGISQGTGADYIPGISVHDFPSRGIVARISGRKTGRIHHLLSHWEEYYFYLLDTDPDVLDIQEQFWLRLSETLDIARRKFKGFPAGRKRSDVRSVTILRKSVIPAI